MKRRFGWAFKPEALVQYLETMTDESFRVPVELRDKFDGKEKYSYKDLTREHHLDNDCKVAYMPNLEGRVARYWSKFYNVPVQPFTPISCDYYIGVSVWDTKTERGFQMVYKQRLEPMMAELNNIFGGPNFESTEAMWWRALDDIERTWLYHSRCMMT